MEVDQGKVPYRSQPDNDRRRGLGEGEKPAFVLEKNVDKGVSKDSVSRTGITLVSITLEAGQIERAMQVLRCSGDCSDICSGLIIPVKTKFLFSITKKNNLTHTSK